MADISKITTLDGTTYDIKDATARQGMSFLVTFSSNNFVVEDEAYYVSPDKTYAEITAAVNAGKHVIAKFDNVGVATLFSGELIFNSTNNVGVFAFYAADSHDTAVQIMEYNSTKDKWLVAMTMLQPMYWQYNSTTDSIELIFPS